MNEKLKKYIDGVFSPYENLHTVKELKEELVYDLEEKLSDCKNQGFDDETAYQMTNDSIEDISEIIESISDLRTTTFKSCVLDNTDFSYSDLSDVSFDNQTLVGTIFNCSGLTGTSFKNAVFRNISFKHTDFSKAIFDGATMDKLTYAVLKGSKANLTNVTVI